LPDSGRLPMPQSQFPSKNQIKQWSKLQHKKYREQYGLFIAEGERCVGQILNNGIIDVECVILNEKSEETHLKGAVSDKTVVYTLPEKDLEELADTENPQGVIAICRIPKGRPDLKAAHLKDMIIATDAVQDPGNLGTIIRTAAWFGVAGLLCGRGTADPWNPKVVRSTAGATGAVPLWSGDLEHLFKQLEKNGWRILMLDGGKGSVPIHEITSRNQTVLVVGNEANGIRMDLLESGRKKVRIDGKSTAVESLNAAIALGIALYGLQVGR